MNITREMIEDRSIPEPNTGCWLWTGSEHGSGYGVIHVEHRRNMLAHRASYTAFRGPIPKGLYVCHRCDFRPCVNPDHLFLGTARENTQDMIRKGRGRRVWGEHVHGAILTPQIILDIRADTRSQKDIAVAYGVGQPHVSRIKSGRVWKHLQSGEAGSGVGPRAAAKTATRG